jgi:subtilisin family serine protease
LLGVSLLLAAPAQAYSGQQWALTYLKASSDWQITKGSGVTVAVIDTGVTPIPDLRGNVLSGADFSTGTSSSGDGQDDLDGHGTGIAAMIAGNGTDIQGLAPGVKILPVHGISGESGVTGAELTAAIDFAVARHAQVINMSLYTPTVSPDVAAAISKAVAADIVVVAATGNQGVTSVDFPASVSGVIAVGAVGQNGAIWSQSNSGARTALVAPGVDIYTDNNLNQQGDGNGTSAATAYVSASAALIRSEHPSWTAGQVIRDLITTADPGPGQSAGQHSDQYGYGIVDPLKALQAAAPSETTNPLLAASGTGAKTTTGGTTKNSSSSPVLLIAVIVVVIIVVLLLVLRSRRGKGPKPPAGPGNYGGGPGGPGGYQAQPYQGYPQQQQHGQSQDPYGQGQYSHRDPYQQQQIPYNPGDRDPYQQ